MSKYELLVLALDIGTSSVRAALYDHAGNMLPKTLVRNERALAVTDDGGAEIDAEIAFKQVLRAIDNVLEKSEKVTGEITHVAPCSFWHSLVGVDAKGIPTTPVYGWADTRSRDYVATLRKKFDEKAVHNQTGARFHSSFWPAKLLWLRTDNPSIWQQTTKWISFSDYVALKLSGEPLTSISMASGTGIFDIRACGWDAKLMRFLRVKPSNLPEIVSDDSQTFQPISKYVKRWPRLENAKWFPAIGDGAANNIGTGCVIKSKAALMIGTSGALRVAYAGEPHEKIPLGLWCYRIDRKRVVVGGALSDGGGLYSWLRENLRLPNNIEAEIAKRRPACHGLTFLPFLAGERSTGYNENAAGAIHGLKSSTDAIDILQAAIESVAYRFTDILSQIKTVTTIRKIIASGGALRESPVWTQIIADVLGRDISLPDTHEASLRGACLLALETIGKIENIETFPAREVRTIMADQDLSKLHGRARERHTELYKLLIR